MRCIHSALGALIVASIVCSTANSQEPRPGLRPFQVGEKQFPGVATAASGYWAKLFPFDVATYGTGRWQSPAMSWTMPTLLIYSRSLDPCFMELAERIDAVLAGRPELRLSGVYLYDAKGGDQQSGYTAEEMVQRIQEVREIADRHKLMNLSIAIAPNNSSNFTSRVGLDDSHDVVMVYFKPKVDPKSHRVVAWLKAVNTADLDKEAIDEIAASLTAEFEAKE